MKSSDPLLAILFTLMLVAAAAVMWSELNRESRNARALENFPFGSQTGGVLQAITQALLLSTFFCAVPLQLALFLAGTLWASVVAVAQGLLLRNMLRWDEPAVAPALLPRDAR